MNSKDADGMANSIDPDQTAPRTALFAQICLSNYYNNNSNMESTRNGIAKNETIVCIVTLW